MFRPPSPTASASLESQEGPDGSDCCGRLLFHEPAGIGDHRFGDVARSVPHHDRFVRAKGTSRHR